jgi:glycosyltransferase involved in cell wall biosynthesis
MNKFTVITVVFNSLKSIEKTILSVISQSEFDNIEFIIIDGGSTDGSIEIIDKYKKYISVFISEPDNGIYDAMNKGIKLSTGIWINFMNAGDTFVSTNIFSKIQFDNFLDIALIYGFSKDESGTSIFPKSEKFAYSGDIFACHQSMFFNKKLLNEELFYPTKYELAGDTDLVCRIVSKGYKISYIKLPVCVIEPGGISVTKGKSWNNRLVRYQLSYKYFGLKYSVVSLFSKLFEVLPRFFYKNENVVISILPRAGLGNCLFTWADGVIFAKNNNLKHYVIGWNYFYIGPILRNEKIKRSYKDYFVYSNGLRIYWLRKFLFSSKFSINPENALLNNRNNTFIFKRGDLVPTCYFDSIIENRELLVNSLFSMLNKDILKSVQNLKHKKLSIHIRRGDYNILGWSTHLDYYIHALTEIRKQVGNNIEAVVFSDGYINELDELLSLDNVKMAESNKDIVQLIDLSMSDIIITSFSTFSYWACFISDAVIVHLPTYEGSNVRYTKGSNKEGDLEFLKDNFFKAN